MFREMRRKKQQIPDSEALEILKHGKTAVLAAAGDDDYPYAVPINYIYFNGSIYIHCAKVGHKIDAIKRNEKVSLTVIDKDDIIQELYTTAYKSIIVFGRAHLLDAEKDKEEMRSSAAALAYKYCPDFQEGIPAEVDREFPALGVIKIEIEHITGKECIELTRERK